MAEATVPRQIKKRDGSIIAFDERKIERAIEKAAYAVLWDEPRSIKIGSAVTDVVIQKVASVFKDKIPAVEAIQDIVEATLMEEGYSHIAKAYILYREKRSEIRLAKSALGLKDDLKLPINTTEVLRRRYPQRLMRFIHSESLKTSQSLAAERGVFPNYEKSVYVKKGLRMRNATVNTVAPTGTISIIAGCSSGIEPLFAISFVRNVLSGTNLFEVNSHFEEMAKAKGFYSKELIGEIAQAGSLKRIKRIPGDVKRTFVTAFDVTPQGHVQIQAAFQKYTDNSVSKTINLPADATVNDVRKIYLLAYKLKCKGITIYRYGSKKDQVLSFGHRKIEDHVEVRGPVSVDSEYSGGCATGPCPF